MCCQISFTYGFGVLKDLILSHVAIYSAHGFTVTKLEELNSSHVSAYLLTLRGHAKSTVRCELSRLRKFLSYLHLLGYTSENLAPHVPEYRLGQAQSIIKIWESEEINAVLETVNRASPKGKRDYHNVYLHL